MFYAARQDHKDSQKEREQWKIIQKHFLLRNLVFLDGSSINCALSRLYGWAEKAERVVEGVSDGRFQRLSVLSTIRLSG